MISTTKDTSKEEVIQNATKISSKAMEDLTTNEAFDQYVQQLNTSPEQAISNYSAMYITKARESGLNDIATLMTAGALIVTGMTNMLYEMGVSDQAVTGIHDKAIKNVVKVAISDDRQQNGYTDSNTPPDEEGRTVSQGPAPGSAPSALGGEENA